MADLIYARDGRRYQRASERDAADLAASKQRQEQYFQWAEECMAGKFSGTLDQWRAERCR